MNIVINWIYRVNTVEEKWSTTSQKLIKNCQITPRKFPPGNYPLDDCSLENCYWGNLHPGQLILRIIAPEGNCPQIIDPTHNCPLNDCSRKITPKIIVQWRYPPGNCRWGKLSFGWFVAYIIPTKKAAPRNIVPKINSTRYIFTPRIRNRSTFLNSCFLLFSFFVV